MLLGGADGGRELMYTKGAVLVLPASVVGPLCSPWGRCRHREASPRGWLGWLALAFCLTLVAWSALTMIGPVMLEGGSLKLPSPGVLDVLVVLYEALQWLVHCARTPSDLHEMASVLYLPEGGFKLHLKQ